jgi:hypothetical protein
MLPNMQAAYITAQIEQRLVAERAEAYWSHRGGRIIPRDNFLVRAKRLTARFAQFVTGRSADAPVAPAAQRLTAGCADC